MTAGPEWERVATVVRSICHDRTWIGWVDWVTPYETPAGPLRTVKTFIENSLKEPDEEFRWRKGDLGAWICERRVIQ